MARKTFAKMYKRGWKSSRLERALKSKKNNPNKKD